LSNDRKQIGHVDGLDDKYLIIKMDLSTPPTIKYLEKKWIVIRTGKWYLVFSNKIQRNILRKNAQDILKMFKVSAKKYLGNKRGNYKKPLKRQFFEGIFIR
jgi:hypothetical protein